MPRGQVVGLLEGLVCSAEAVFLTEMRFLGQEILNAEILRISPLRPRRAHAEEQPDQLVCFPMPVLALEVRIELVWLNESVYMWG